MDVKNAWNERTVDTIPYVSISLYPYIFISSTKTGSQYFLTPIYRLQDINGIFCRTYLQDPYPTFTVITDFVFNADLTVIQW